MRIGPTVPQTGTQPSIGDVVRQPAQPQGFRSTLVGETRNSFSFRQIVSTMLSSITRFFRWVFSWLCCSKEERASQAIDYFRVVDTGRQKTKYRLVLQGKGTENELRFASKSVFLEGISFPDKKMRSHIRDMLLHIIEEERLDSIRTSYLKDAKTLWDCGLRTKSSVFFDPSNPKAPLNKWIKKVARKASKHPALEVVEDATMRSVIEDATDAETMDIRHHTFQPELARRKLKGVEHSLGYSFDINEHIKRAGEEDSYYRRCLEELMKDGEIADQSDPIQAELPLEALFALADAAKSPVDRAITQSVVAIFYNE